MSEGRTIADIIGGDVGLRSSMESHLHTLQARERELRVMVARKHSEYEHENAMPKESRRASVVGEAWDKFQGFKGRLNEVRRILKMLEAVL